MKPSLRLRGAPAMSGRSRHRACGHQARARWRVFQESRPDCPSRYGSSRDYAMTAAPVRITVSKTAVLRLDPGRIFRLIAHMPLIILTPVSQGLQGIISD